MENQAEETEGVDEVTGSVSCTDEIRALNREMVITFKRLCPDFMRWLEEFSRFGGNPIDAMALWESPGKVFKALFFTERFEYTVAARPDAKTEKAEEYDSGYLGAVVSSRKPRAGEDWTRGTDLADGSYSKETWQRIMADIIGHEMVRLGK